MAQVKMAFRLPNGSTEHRWISLNDYEISQDGTVTYLAYSLDRTPLEVALFTRDAKSLTERLTSMSAKQAAKKILKALLPTKVTKLFGPLGAAVTIYDLIQVVDGFLTVDTRAEGYYTEDGRFMIAGRINSGDPSQFLA